MRVRPRGVTIAELLVAASLLGLLLIAIFAVYRSGANAWAMGDAKTELLQQVQLGVSRMAREAERSVYGGVTIAGDEAAVSFISAEEDGSFETETDTTRMLWKKYVVFYHDPQTQTLMSREVELAGPIVDAQPIESTLGAIDNYRHGGKIVSRHVDSLQVAFEPPALLTFELGVKKDRYGRRDAETRVLARTARVRNE